MLISELNRFSVEELIEALPYTIRFETGKGTLIIEKRSENFITYYDNVVNHSICCSSGYTLKWAILELYERLISQKYIRVEVTENNKLIVEQINNF